MPAVVEAAADGAAPAPGNGIMSMIFRLGLMYLAMNYFGTKSGPKENQTGIACNFEKGQMVDLAVYVHTDRRNFGDPVWTKPMHPLCAEEKLKVSLNFGEDMISPIIAANSTVWMTTRFTASDEKLVTGSGRLSFYQQAELTTHRASTAAKDGKSLLSKDNEVKEPAPPAPATAIELPDDTSEDKQGASAKEPPLPWKMYWKPNMTISVLDEFQPHVVEKLPPHLQGALRMDPRTNTYYPIVHISEFWLLQDYMVELNSTTTEVDLHLEFSSMTKWAFQFEVAMAQSFAMHSKNGLMQDTQTDEMKRIFLEGNPWLLALTTVVSLLHSVFDMLAFKNDIGFWKSNKSMEGLSARSIVINAFCQLVIFFYLLDNDTSFVILISAGMGTAIEFWKVTKAMDVSLVVLPSGLPWVSVKDRVSYVDSNTKQYDKDAMKYLSWAVYPLMLCYCAYSLVYEKHKSWYSWVLGSLVGCVYAFGFMLMCPQLYLNYKLKSVAHLPWRQMSYKFLNTIIDDLFAFVIKMPFLHRLAVFRDDAIFLVYIYQRWIYRVDMKRVNEFGFVGDEGADDSAIQGGSSNPAALTDGTDAVNNTAAKGGQESTGRKNAKQKNVPKADTKSEATLAPKDK